MTELWIRKTTEGELSLLLSLEKDGCYLTRRIGGCVKNQVSQREIEAHHKHKKDLIIQLFKEKFLIMNCVSFTVPELNGNIWNDDAEPDNILKFLEEVL